MRIWWLRLLKKNGALRPFLRPLQQKQPAKVTTRLQLMTNGVTEKLDPLPIIGKVFTRRVQSGQEVDGKPASNPDAPCVQRVNFSRMRSGSDHPEARCSRQCAGFGRRNKRRQKVGGKRAEKRVTIYKNSTMRDGFGKIAGCAPCGVLNMVQPLSCSLLVATRYDVSSRGPADLQASRASPGSARHPFSAAAIHGLVPSGLALRARANLASR